MFDKVTHLFFNNIIFVASMLEVKSVIYLLIVALFGIIIYQNTFCCSTAYSQETELRFIKQLGVKGSGAGQFTFPHSLTVDKLGNIYVGDTGNKRIQKFSPNGTFLTSWGSEGSGDGQFLGLHEKMAWMLRSFLA